MVIDGSVQVTPDEVACGGQDGHQEEDWAVIPQMKSDYHTESLA